MSMCCIVSLLFFFFFFFSSRRRHTRCSRDWSSDVCSSDLVGSQPSLLIQRHDANTQQTELELIYGRARADAVKIATPSGEFNERTRAAVAGDVSKQEYLAATDYLTTVIALGVGQVVHSCTQQ